MNPLLRTVGVMYWLVALTVSTITTISSTTGAPSPKTMFGKTSERCLNDHRQTISAVNPSTARTQLCEATVTISACHLCDRTRLPCYSFNFTTNNGAILKLIDTLDTVIFYGSVTYDQIISTVSCQAKAAASRLPNSPVRKIHTTCQKGPLFDASDVFPLCSYSLNSAKNCSVKCDDLLIRGTTCTKWAATTFLPQSSTSSSEFVSRKTDSASKITTLSSLSSGPTAEFVFSKTDRTLKTTTLSLKSSGSTKEFTEKKEDPANIAMLVGLVVGGVVGGVFITVVFVFVWMKCRRRLPDIQNADRKDSHMYLGLTPRQDAAFPDLITVSTSSMKENKPVNCMPSTSNNQMLRVGDVTNSNLNTNFSQNPDTEDIYAEISDDHLDGVAFCLPNERITVTVSNGSEHIHESGDTYSRLQIHSGTSTQKQDTYNTVGYTHSRTKRETIGRADGQEQLDDNVVLDNDETQDAYNTLSVMSKISDRSLDTYDRIGDTGPKEVIDGQLKNYPEYFVLENVET